MTNENEETVAVMVHTLIGDRYGDLKLRFAVLDTTLGRVNLLQPYDGDPLGDLIFECSYSRSGTDAYKPYGIRLGTKLDERDTSVTELESVAKLVKRIRAGMDKIENEWGQTRDFAALAVRLLKVLKIKKVFTPVSNEYLSKLTVWRMQPAQSCSAIEYEATRVGLIVEHLLSASRNNEEY